MYSHPISQNNSNPKICFVLGTRPEIIKLYSCIKFCINNNLDYFIIHTNQHYNPNMDLVFFQELNLPLPEFNLNVGSGNHATQTAKMLTGIEDILLTHKPDIMIVQGDTNSTMAGALVATKMNIKVAHIEAGLRSYDRSMPEEINRIMVDHVSDWLFVPTADQGATLLKEDINQSKIHIVGNTVVDAVFGCKELSNTQSTILNRLNLFSIETLVDPKIQEANNEPEEFDLFSKNDKNDNDKIPAISQKQKLDDLFGDLESDQPVVSTIVNQNKTTVKDYFLLTCHRPSNTDNPENFEAILGAVQELCVENNCVCIFPAHPRLQSQKALINSFDKIILIDPTGFVDSIALQSNSKMILTDSGGIQEESCILNRKAIILRTNTERPESVQVGGAVLLQSITKQEIKNQFYNLINKSVNWTNPFGDGQSAKSIMEIILK